MAFNSRTTRFLLACILIAGLAVSIVPPFSQTTRAAESDAQPHTWTTETVGGAGQDSSLAFDSAGNPGISYHGDRSGLMYAHWDGTSWKTETVDKGTWVGFYTCLAFDSQGNAAISYCDVTNSLLKYAHWDGSSWRIEWIDANVQFDTSLVFDAHGNPCVSYFRHSGWYDLKYAHWDGTSWKTETVDSAGDVGRGNSLALDSEGNPAISYYDWTSYQTADVKLKYAHWDGEQWNIEVIESTGAQADVTSLAFDPQGVPAIAYFGNWALNYAHWNGLSWNIGRVAAADQDSNPSLSFDSQGNPAISYHSDGNHDLKYAHCNGVSWNIETVDSVGAMGIGVGEFSSLAFDPRGVPAIAYFSDLCGLKYAFLQTTPGPEYVGGNVEAWAVIIGVSDYQNFPSPSGLKQPWENYDLSYPSDEALHLYNKLSPILGQSHTRLLTDSGASNASIKSAVLDWLAPQEGPEDIVLVFFSGHGSSGYLCPYDSLETSYANDVSCSSLDSWLDTLDSERVVIILDSCESGGYAACLSRRGRVVLAASDASESAWGFSDLESGVFSYYLLDGLGQMSSVDTDGDRRISAEELFQYAKPKVVSYTTEHADVQHPQLFDGFAGELDLFSLATISVPTVVQDGEGTRGVFSSWSDGNTSASRTVTVAEATTLVANYTRQYYLSVQSKYGTPQGAGWYDEGATATFSVSGGSAWYRSFGGWSGDSDAASQTATIVMNGPQTLTVVWRPSAYLWAAVLCGAAVLVALSVLTLRRLKRTTALRRIREDVLTPPVPPL